MPKDRELLDTGSQAKLLGNRIPMTAVTEEAVLDMQSGAVDQDGEILKKKPFGFLFWFAIGFVGVVIVSAVLANVLPLQNPNFQNYSAINQTASGAHWLGTDDLGRDLLSRLVFGARVSLIVGFAGVAIGLIFGGTAGLVSGYRGGRLDVGLNAISFIILAFPAIVAVIAIVTFWGTSLVHITIILGIATIPLMYRVIRASSLAFAQRDFVIAAKTMGASDTRIVLREILPNVIPVTVTFSLITVAGLIVIEGTLAFLGLSVALPTPSWGNLINEGSSNDLLSINPYIMLWPALAMFLLLWSINLIGDRLRQRFDIREGLL
jgi:peptide/nickel transport system permease protein